MKTKKKLRFWIFVRNSLLAIAAAVGIWVIFSNSMTAYEKNKYPAIGQLVEVEGNNMHVYTKGNGDNTILLLGGLGTAAPSLDFDPLINELTKNNKVVVVEPFGYGWSDITSRERTVENIVEEIRTALEKLNIQGPYILMPHSISGIYSMYYANTYPDEVKGVIGIDPTLPKALAYFGETAPAMPAYFSYVGPTGIARLALSLSPDNFLPIAEGGTYTEENLKMTKAISAWKGNNKNVVDEANEIKRNIGKTVDMNFPANMPVLFFTTKEDKVTEDGKNNVTFYETQLTNYPASKIVTLQGHHYLHWTRYKEMSKEVNEFIEEVDSMINKKSIGIMKTKGNTSI
ncbi:alpha/beta hydrolase [Bacillus sp. FJAT-18017]|uniref:alpha/beta fold hydrolase n=1 Tax=Bacillus sp. FJAT-18017 TaxID=1705566 RepID=UPI0006BC26FA|nr:alpha/beta hydrolase [Bacillus sp. FJAT-18017]ALC91490.1 alpha/beta hydrolase [Bacillus sp. FJAT-18017]